MAPKPWPFITDGIIGDVPINWVPAADSDKKVILLPSPGLLSLCTLTDCTEVRGLYAWGSYLYAVARRGSESVLWRVDTSGGFSELGTITSSVTGQVWMVNNATQLCIADGTLTGGYVYTPSTGLFVQITDANFLGAGSVSYQDTYGLFHMPGTNQWQISKPSDFTGFNANDNYFKEGTTDNIREVLSDRLEVWIFGEEKGSELWSNTGGANTSDSTATFQRNQGGLVSYGCGSAGTPVIFDNTVAWLSENGQLIRALGYSPQVISTDMFGRDIQEMALFSDARSFVYIDREHTFMQINFTVGDITYVYDAKTKLFHKRSSYLDDLSGYGRHRANCYASLGNKHYVGDYSNGKIYEMSGDYYDDDGHEIQSILHSQEVGGGIENIFFPEVQVMFEMGVGLVSGSGSDPQAMLDKSNDGGKTWNTCGWVSMGKIGEYTKRAIWYLQGSDTRRMYRLTVTDPVLKRVLGIDWGKPRP